MAVPTTNAHAPASIAAAPLKHESRREGHLSVLCFAEPVVVREGGRLTIELG